MSRYDWTDKRIPDWVQEIATDGDGEVCGYRKAYKSEPGNWWVDYECLGCVSLWYVATCDDWRESLEQRPFPEEDTAVVSFVPLTPEQKAQAQKFTPSPVLAAALARITPPYTSKTTHLSPQQARALYLYIEELKSAQGADLAGEGGNFPHFGDVVLTLRRNDLIHVLPQLAEFVHDLRSAIAAAPPNATAVILRNARVELDPEEEELFRVLEWDSVEVIL